LLTFVKGQSLSLEYVTCISFDKTRIYTVFCQSEASVVLIIVLSAEQCLTDCRKCWHRSPGFY